MLDAQGRYLYLNEAALRQGRKAREELLGKKITDMYPGLEDTAMYACVQRCLRERVAQELDNEFVYADGKRAWVTLRMERVEKGVSIFSIYITRQKLAEVETQHRLRRLSALCEIDLSIISSTPRSRSSGSPSSRGGLRDALRGAAGGQGETSRRAGTRAYVAARRLPIGRI